MHLLLPRGKGGEEIRKTDWGSLLVGKKVITSKATGPPAMAVFLYPKKGGSRLRHCGKGGGFVSLA